MPNKIAHHENAEPVSTWAAVSIESSHYVREAKQLMEGTEQTSQHK